MKWNTEDRSSHFLYLFAINCCELARKPKRKGKGLQTFLVVQFHPAPPSIASPVISC